MEAFGSFKTQAIVFGNSALPKKLSLQGQDIEWAPTVKYLGVTIDRRLDMAKHVKSVIKKNRAARALLKPVARSRLPLRVKLGIYKTYLRPILNPDLRGLSLVPANLHLQQKEARSRAVHLAQMGCTRQQICQE